MTIISKAQRILFIALIFIIGNETDIAAHESDSNLMYLGNEAVLYNVGNNKVLFDPFFHKGFSKFTKVPEQMRKKIFNNQAPFNDINIVFISHAHGDHFDAKDLLKYLSLNTNVELVAPKQAVDMIVGLDGYSKIQPRVTAIDLSIGDKPLQLIIGSIKVTAIRIPHTGWPRLKELENISYQVSTLDSEVQLSLDVLHLGDADSNVQHFSPYQQHWVENPVNALLPPFWFAYSAEGNKITREIIGAKKVINIHVPTKVPIKLKQSGEDYFSNPGEIRVLTK